MRLWLTLLACLSPSPPETGHSASPPTAPGASTPILAAEGNDAWLLWMEPIDEGIRLRLARSIRGTWGRGITLAEGTDLVIDDARPPRLAVSGGELTVAYEVASEGGTLGMISVSNDHGRTWRSESWPPLDDAPLWTLTSAGELIHAGHLDLCDCAAPSTAGGDPPWVALCTRDALSQQGIVVARPTPAGWKKVQVQPASWQIAGCTQAGPALAATPQGLAVAWYNGAPEPAIKLSFSEDGGRTFEAPLRVDDGDLSRRPTPGLALAPLPDGAVIVAWIARSGAEALLLARWISPDGEASPPQPLDRLPYEQTWGVPQIVSVDDGLLAVWTDRGSPDRPGGLRAHRQSVASLQPGTVPALRATRPAVASPLPDRLSPLPARRLDGTPHTVRSGEPLLLSVLAGWCGACMEPLTALELPPHVRRVALILDGRPPHDLQPLREAGWEVLFADLPAIQRSLGSAHIPSSYLFDAVGALRWSTRDPLHPEDPTLNAASRRIQDAPDPQPALGQTQSSP